MKVLFIGGTGTISMAITKALAAKGEEVYLLNRGNRSSELPDGVKTIIADINNEAEVAEKIKGFYGDNLAGFAGSKRSEYGYFIADVKAGTAPFECDCIVKFRSL